MGPIPILLVSADAARSRALLAALESFQLVPYLCLNCREAQAALGCKPFGMVFCDVELPDGTFREVLRQAKDCLPAPAVVVTSRLDDARVYLEAMQLGAFDFLLWPYNPAEVGRVVRTALAEQLAPGARRKRAEVARAR